MHSSVAGHGMSQPPQWSRLKLVNTQPSGGQQLWEPKHAAPPPTEPVVPPHVHAPDAQVSPAPQATPQAPQCASSLDVVAQPEAPQHVSDAPHAAPAPSLPASGPQEQRPLEQVSPAPHVTPQPPQWLSSALGSTQPPSHHVRPAAHVSTQRYVPPL